MAESVLIPRIKGAPDCTDPVIGGAPSFRYDWVPKHDNHDNDPIDVDLDLPPSCIPWYYYYMKVGSMWALEDVVVSGSVLCVGDVLSNNGAHRLSNKKNLPFDMEHPNKPGWRLRHVCIEGPEIAVYCRGTIGEDGIIELPSFWDGLVNMDDMTINITPVGHWQELYIKERNGNKVIVLNNCDSKINANYHIVARRLDDDLIVEYEGETYLEYPNGNEGYSFNFEHTYVENFIREEVKKLVTNND